MTMNVVKILIPILIICMIFYETIYTFGMSVFKHETIFAPSNHERASNATDIAVKEFSDYLSHPEKKPLKLRCSTCAFVTGSGHLLGSKKGSEIDSMDCIFRSNDAPTIGFEEDVGSKTTIRTVDRISLRNFRKPSAKYIKNELLRSPPPVILSVFWPPGLQEEYRITHKIFPHLRLYAGTTEKFEKTLEIYRKQVTPVKGAWWSNGFRTIYMAHEFCDVVHVYGINDDEFCKHVFAKEPGYKDVPYHYYGGGVKNCDHTRAHDRRRTEAHPFTKEKVLFKTLVKEWGNLHFHAPEWPKN